MAINGKSTPRAENESITFDDSQVSSTKQIAKYFNRQFTTSKLDRHTYSRETRLVSKEIQRKSLTSAVTFTTDQVIKGISSCRNTQAFGPYKLLSPRASWVQSDRIPHCTLQRLRHILSESVDLVVIHCHPNPETRQGLLSQHFLSVYLTPLSSSKSYGSSLNSHRQQPPASLRIQTRCPILTLYHFCFTTTDEWYRDKFQPKENSTSYSLCRF